MGENGYRVDRRTVLGDWPVLVLLALDLIFGLWALPRLPEQVPLHWGLSGHPDRYGPAWQGALLFPALSIAIYLGMLWAPLIDPRRRNYALFDRTYRLLRQLFPVVFVLLHVTMVLNALGHPVDPPLVVRLVLPLLFVLIGNFMGRFRHNYFVGIRTPWTLASPAVWTRTHRAAGRLWVAGGLVQLAAAFLPSAWGFGVFMGVLAVMVAVPVVHSYLLYRQEAGEGGEPGE